MTTNLSNSDILNLESLITQYNNTKIQYDQAMQTYLSSLNNSTTTNNNLVILPNKVYSTATNTPDKSYSNINNVNDCVALCSADSNCMGANYNTNQNNCSINYQPGTIQSSGNAKKAIVPQELSNLYTVQQLNLQLINLTVQINTIANGQNMTTMQENTNTSISTTSASLNSQYQQLLSEQTNIKNLLDEYKQINQKSQDLTIYVNQKNTMYINNKLFEIR